MLELLDKEFEDYTYLAVLADYLEDQAHPWAMAVRLLANKVHFLVYDNRPSTNEDAVIDLYSPPNTGLYLEGSSLRWLNFIQSINPEEKIYYDKVKHLIGMQRDCFATATDAIKAMVNFLKEKTC